MAIRPKDVYRGKRPYRTLVTALVCIVLALLVGAVVLFYSLQKYIVYGQDGLSLEIPALSTAVPAEETEAPGAVLREPVEIVVTTPNFDEVETDAGEGLSGIKAVYVPAGKVSEAGLASAAATAEERGANALVLQLKPEDGQLAYLSTSDVAESYGVNGAFNLREAISALKENGLWLAAALSVCVDEAMATRNTPIALKNAEGNAYEDAEGTWLDPYNRAVREYIIGLMAELSEMGFDEILLTNIAYPQDGGGAVHSQETTSAMDVDTCISNLAMRLAEAMDAYEVRVSALYGEQNGQDSAFFLKVFDRLFRYTASDNLEKYRSQVAGEMEKGDIGNRFVPIMQSVPEDSGSWVLDTSI